MADHPALNEILNQAARSKGTPVILMTRKGEPLWVIMPFARDNYTWLQGSHRRAYQHRLPGKRPFWSVPKSWLDDLTRRFVARFGACYLVQRHHEREVCAPACWDAQGLECQCSCMGEHHGEGHPGGRWYEVSETFAFTSGSMQLHYKLIRAKAPAR